MAVSLGQVAARAGVSGCTASKVLSSTPGRISPQTHERVLRAAQELGYEPNRLARSLGRRRTDTIGLMISGLANPFFAHIMETAEAIAQSHGYQALADSAPSVRGTFGGHGKLRGWPVDGILMWSNGQESATDFLGPSVSETPVVYIGGGQVSGADSVVFDGCRGIQEVMQHLLERGRRRIAYLAPFPHSAEYHDSRYDTYAQACHDAGLPDLLLETPGHEETREAGLAFAQELVTWPAVSRPDALLCHNDLLAIGVNCGLRRAGVRVPEDIALVGQEGIKEGQFLPEPLTTVKAPVLPLCEAAVALLLRRMGGDKTSPPEQIVIATHLSVGGTT